MVNRHEKTLAQYQNLGSIYSYGYGAMRQYYQSFHDAIDNLDQFVKGIQDVISAVEFRTAEIMASHVMAEMAGAEASKTSGVIAAVAPTNAIYETPKDGEDNFISK